MASIKEALELAKAESYMENGRLNLDDFIELISKSKAPINSVSVDSNTGDSAEIIINGEHKFVITDDGKGDLDIEYVGAGKFGVLTLSATRGIYTYPTGGNFTVTNNSTGGALSVSSDAPDVATAILSGDTITVTPGIVEGKAKIIVKSAAIGEYAENKAIYIARVQNGVIKLSATPYTGAYDGQTHNAFTNVSVEPAGINVEYSLDGVNYSSTMPKLKDTSSFTVSVKASKEGYKTQVETYTVTVNKADGGLTLSSTGSMYIKGRASYFTFSGNTGTVSATSSDINVAEISLSGNTINVTPKAVGTSIITVISAETNNYKEKTETYTVTVPNNYAVGDSVTVKGYDFYSIGDDGVNVTLLYKTSIGDANWPDAMNHASIFGSSLGGTGRLMTKAEAEGVAAGYRNIGPTCWLQDVYDSNCAWIASGSNGPIWYGLKTGVNLRDSSSCDFVKSWNVRF